MKYIYSPVDLGPLGNIKGPTVNPRTRYKKNLTERGEGKEKKKVKCLRGVKV